MPNVAAKKPWALQAVQAPAIDPIKVAIDQLAEIRAKQSELKKREDALKKIISALPIGDNRGNKAIASVSESERESFDSKCFREDHPQLAEQYTRSTTVRTVRIKALV